MIGIIDYGMGNLGSVENALRYMALESRIFNRAADWPDCQAVILPGVGAFGDCMTNLQEAGLCEPILRWVGAGRPFLGICLGMQVLFASSEESPGARGLALFGGTVRRFTLPPQYKVPQIGWNQVQPTRPGCPLFAGVPDPTFFYFVHSYYVAPADPALTVGVTDYGGDYASAVWRDNVMATQFHPERSHRLGLRMLANFARHAGLAPKLPE